MNELNIQEIANARIAELHESGEIKKQIEAGIEKTIKEAINDAIGSYTFKMKLECKVAKELSVVANNIGFDGFTKHLTESLNKVISKYAKKDLAKKIEKEFTSIYLDKRESIKLSEIFEAYKEYLQNELDWEKQRDWGGIRLERKDDICIEYKVGSPQKTGYGSSRYDTEKEFSFCIFGVRNTDNGAIGCVYLDGNSIKDGLISRCLSDFETLILNLMYNKTKVIIDCDEDYDLYFDNEY